MFELLINARKNQTRVAYVKDKQIIDLKIEHKTSPTLVGSVYKGRVIRVLPGMQAAFVDIGLDKAAFLYVRDIQTLWQQNYAIKSNSNADSAPKEAISEPDTTQKTLIQNIVKKDQELMVQVSKDPLGSKGARITTQLSFAGRAIVLLPNFDHSGISHRIESEEERTRLEELINELRGKHGVIVRTAGEGTTREELKLDLDYLTRLSLSVQENYQKKKQVGLVHTEIDIELKALRDLLSDDVKFVTVDEEGAYNKIVYFLTQFMPKYKNRVRLHKGASPIFDTYGIELEISRSLSRKVWLKSGGNIVLDEAEALVVIDVNTGRYVGKQNLEDTILEINLEAAKEIAHQLRIRNCGGIIIIDFIDMEKQFHKDKVLSVLEAELSKDRAKTSVISMSEIGIVEMTRKRTRPSLLSLLCKPCPDCGGRGYVKNKMTTANEIFRSIEREASRLGINKTFAVKCHQSIADWIYEEDSETIEELESKLGCHMMIKVEPSFHIEQHEISLI